MKETINKSAHPSFKEKLNKGIKIISAYLIGQGSIQILQIISGFLLIRWLSIEEYAQYSMTFAFQATAQMLVEFGFSGAIIALVGDKINDKLLIGKYIHAGQQLRNRMFLIVGSICLFLFPYLTLRQDWSFSTTLLLLIAILSNLYFSGWSSYYGAPLKIHRSLNKFYQIQVKNSAIKLFLIGVLYITSLLNAWLAALSGSLQTILNGFFLKKASFKYIEEPSEIDNHIKNDMMRYISPMIPGIVFGAFQSQISIFIISFFGQTENISEVGALNRIGQIFNILNLASNILIAPYIARQTKIGLLNKYVGIVIVSIFISSIIVIIGICFPYPFLYLLGSKYLHLQKELGLLLLSSSLGYINGVIWAMNAARKWIFYWVPLITIPGIIIVQVFSVNFLTLNTTYNVLLFSMITNIFVLLIRVIVGIYGFLKK